MAKILDKIKGFFGNKGMIVRNDDYPLSIKNGKLIINGDFEIIVSGNLKIQSDKHIFIDSGKDASNDEYGVHAIHLNDEKRKKIANEL